MPIIDVESSGSALGPLLLNDDLIASAADFMTVEESLGQLYAYRHSNTSVTLGTRRAVTENPLLVTAVGIYAAAANGKYRCVVENFANGTSESLIRITTVNEIGNKCSLTYNIYTSLYHMLSVFVFENLICQHFPVLSVFKFSPLLPLFLSSIPYFTLVCLSFVPSYLSYFLRMNYVCLEIKRRLENYLIP